MIRGAGSGTRHHDEFAKLIATLRCTTLRHCSRARIISLPVTLSQGLWRPARSPFSVTAYIGMACIVMAYVVMACIVMAHTAMALYKYGLYSQGRYSYGVFSTYLPVMQTVDRSLSLEAASEPTKLGRLSMHPAEVFK